MRQRAVWQKLKNFGSFCLIMLLLPYVVTVFVHGKDFEAAGNKEKVFVNVRKTKETVSFAQLESVTDSIETNAAENVAGTENELAVHKDRKEETEIIQVPWEEYFIGIMGREVPVDAEMEFLKAQAVLLRTKLYQELDAQDETETGDPGNTAAPDNNTQPEMEADMQEDQADPGNNIQPESETDIPKIKTLDEQYLTRQELEEKAGASETESYYNRLQQAMQETENQVLFYQDTYALVPFHQSSNGMTRSAQEVLGVDTSPYLAVRECPLDKEADDEMQITTFDYKDVQAKCQSFLVAVAEEEANKTYAISDFEIISHDSAGYVLQMRIGETICTGDQFRDALSLTSSAFSLKDVDGKLKITTMGKGHGLGMSQWTAQQMAKSGKNYEEILQFFFEGTTLTDGGEAAEKVG